MYPATLCSNHGLASPLRDLSLHPISISIQADDAYAISVVAFDRSRAPLYPFILARRSTHFGRRGRSFRCIVHGDDLACNRCQVITVTVTPFAALTTALQPYCVSAPFTSPVQLLLCTIYS